MFRTIVNHLFIDLLSLRVLNPTYELDGAWVNTHTTYKSNKLYLDIFFVFLLVNNEKQSMIQSKMCLVISLNVNPINEG